MHSKNVREWVKNQTELDNVIVRVKTKILNARLCGGEFYCRALGQRIDSVNEVIRVLEQARGEL